MIIHFVIDDKFIRHAIHTFSLIDEESVYYHISDHRNFNYISGLDIKIINSFDLLADEFLEILKKSRVVIFHTMNPDFLKIVNLAKKKKTIWIGWGYDYYETLYKNENDIVYFKPFTRGLISKKNNFYKEFRAYISRLKFSFSLRHLSYFAPVLEDEYHLIKNHNFFFKPKFKSWNYGILEDNLLPQVLNEPSGCDILLGNSATPSNNHLDVLHILKEFDLGGKKIYLPLAYGNDAYRYVIREKSEELFGQKINTIVDFIPYERYMEHINSCRNVIMPHIRQQGLGNIVLMMYLGANIFLYKENPIYTFFKREGAFIFSIDELSSFPDLLDSKLLYTEIKRNQLVIERFWSKENIIRRTLQMLD